MTIHGCCVTFKNCGGASPTTTCISALVSPASSCWWSVPATLRVASLIPPAGLSLIGPSHLGTYAFVRGLRMRVLDSTLGLGGSAGCGGTHVFCEIVTVFLVGAFLTATFSNRYQ
jgi:hypothetical protein